MLNDATPLRCPVGGAPGVAPGATLPLILSLALLRNIYFVDRYRIAHWVAVGHTIAAGRRGTCSIGSGAVRATLIGLATVEGSSARAATRQVSLASS